MGKVTRLKFLKTDPLPLVSVRVNGGDEVTFFIDTGGSEVALDTEFARGAWRAAIRRGARHFFRRPARRGSADADRIPRARRLDRQEPAVVTLALRQLSESFGVKRIDGILGTTLFYHFLATLDYPHGELVLRRKDAKSLEQFAAESSARSVAVPFWIASDHFMVGWGRVETLPPTLLFVDTGLAGAGVKLAEPVIKQAGIKLEEDKAYEGAGGGGKAEDRALHRAVGFPSETSRNDNVPGLYDGPFPWENSFGFHLAGMVGHDFFKPYAVTFDFEACRFFCASSLCHRHPPRASQPQQAPHPQRAALLEQAALGRVAFLLEGRVERLKGDGHPRESGCPIGKWEEVGHSRTPVPGIVVNR